MYIKQSEVNVWPSKSLNRTSRRYSKRDTTNKAADHSKLAKKHTIHMYMHTHSVSVYSLAMKMGGGRVRKAKEELV